MEKIKKTAIIIGTYINAYSLYRAIVHIGFNGNIYAINPSADPNKKPLNLLDVCIDDFKCINAIIDSKENCANVVNNIPGEEKYVFFTSEIALNFMRDAMESGLIYEKTYIFDGPQKNREILDNKFLLYKFIETNQIALIPQTIDGIADPFEVFSDGFIMRAKAAFVGSIKTPGVELIKTREELEKNKLIYYDLGLSEKDWCYQKCLDIEPEKNIAVMGWFDEKEHVIMVDKKLERHPKATGTGDVVEILTDYPSILVDQVIDLLTRVNYKGPFEVEYIYDSISEKYYIIDLNARYWMQNELVNINTDYYMIKKNLNMNPELPTIKSNYVRWINTNQLIYNLLKLNFKWLFYCKNAVLAPGIKESIKWIIKRYL